VSGGERGARAFARVLLVLYPSGFRERHGHAYEEGAAHIWRREVRRVGRVRGALRIVRIMAVDAWSAAPREWRGARDAAGRAEGVSMRALRGWSGEFRRAARSLIRQPGYTLLVVGTLGLGIGVSAAVFGALDRVILRPLPYADADRLAYLGFRHRERGWGMAPWDEVLDRWRAGVRTVETMETVRQLSMVRTGDGSAEVLGAIGYSAGLPAMLGVSALRGRLPDAKDAAAGAAPTIVLSEQYWRNGWGRDPDIIGRTVQLNDTIFTVAGVWPAWARLNLEAAPEVFRVLPADQEAPRGDFTLVLAKLARGATPALVESELAGALGGIEDVSLSMVPVVNAPYGFLAESYVRGLWLVFAGGLVLMIVAVVNAANLVLGRSAGRTDEIAIRRALGGSRFRLVQLFLAESATLAAAGMAAGVVIAAGTQRVLALLEPGRLMPSGAIGLQGRAVLFACGLAVLAAAICALVPLLHTRRATADAQARGLHGGRVAGARSRLRTVLIGAQTSLAVLLVVGAALVGRSFDRALHVATGMDLDRLAVVSLSVSRPPYDTPEARAAYFERVREALAGLPGAAGVTVAPNPPLAFSVRGGLPYLVGESEPALTGAEFTSVTSAEPNFFEVAGIPIVAGRTFVRGESGVAIVNESFARRHGGDVVGRALRFASDTLVWTIVGVAGDVRAHGIGQAEDAVQIYHARSAGRASTYERFLVRSELPPATLLAAARARLAEIDPDIPLREATTGPEMLRDQTSRFRFLAFLLGGFALLGLVFALAGVYGAVTLDVHRRVREVGVRMALGASHRQVAADVLRRGLAPVAAGAVAGIVVALWTGPILESLLFEMSARDPLSAVAALVLVLGTAVLACLGPALRAARVDPATTLRAD
jgi:putative ABC transport system permease protein